MLHQGCPRIDQVVHAVCPVPLKKMGKNSLGLRLLLIQIGRQIVAQKGDAFLKFLSSSIDRTQNRINSRLIGLYGMGYLRAKTL